MYTISLQWEGRRVGEGEIFINFLSKYIGSEVRGISSDSSDTATSRTILTNDGDGDSESAIKRDSDNETDEDGTRVPL